MAYLYMSLKTNNKQLLKMQRHVNSIHIGAISTKMAVLILIAMGKS